MVSKMPRAVVDLDDFAESDNIMIYSDTGVGKTELVSQLPGRVLVLSSENGTSVIKRSMRRRGASASEAKRFKVWPIRKFSDMEEAYAWNLDNPGVFDWVAVDTATSIQQRAMRAAMEKAVNHNPEKRDIDLPDRGEHQKMQNAMKRMIADFNELPVNVLWLAQAMRREDKDGNEIVVPFIMGKDYEVSAFACAQMQAFGYMLKKPNGENKGVTDRVIIWDSFVDGGGVNYWSKDRYDVFPKMCLMSSGDEQKMLLSDLLGMINANGKAKAVAAVETRDEPEPEPDAEPDADAETEDADEDTERREELLALKPFQLAKIMKTLDLDPKEYKGQPMGDIVEAILEAEWLIRNPEEAEPEETEESEDAEPEAEPEDEAEPEPEVEPDAPEEATHDDWVKERRAELMHCTPVELKDAVEAAGMTVAEFKGVPRDKIVEGIILAEEELEGSGTEEPDEESDPEEELDLEGMFGEEAEPETETEPEPAKPAKPAAKKTAATRRLRANT